VSHQQHGAPPYGSEHRRRRKRSPIEPRDLLLLTSPAVLAYKAARLMLGRKSDAGSDPGERDPEFVEHLLETVEPALRWYFRAEVHGGEHIPAEGPALLVGNHSGGMQTFETLVIFREVMRRHGRDRALYGLGHNLVFDDPTFRKYAGRFGGLRAGHDNAKRAFERDAMALVYPGSDLDSFRPWGERDRVVFGKRTGFMRLVLENRVPIVPVVTAGAQEAFYVLTRGERLARALGLKRLLRTEVFPIALSLPWGLAPATMPYIPLPTKMVTRFGPPIRFDHLGPDAARDPETIARCAAEVQATMQGMLDGLSAQRRWPVIG
jgi:1-acyl-sn-glycerol-3-phosphate acyltransferase